MAVDGSGQKASSDAWTPWKVAERPTALLPAVATSIEDRVSTHEMLFFEYDFGV